jgi:hypothetical protein
MQKASKTNTAHAIPARLRVPDDMGGVPHKMGYTTPHHQNQSIVVSFNGHHATHPQRAQFARQRFISV